MKPDFGEAQLRDIVLRAFNGDLKHFHSPTPALEAILGYDHGLFIPNFGHVNEYGCNFFIQYKISNLFTNKKALGWNDWNEPFFRFELGYNNDFSQRDALIKISKNGNNALYVTNHVIKFKDIMEILRNNEILISLPALSVDSILENHQKVSFTSKSHDFYLHSDVEKLKKVNLKEYTKTAVKTNLTEDLKLIKDIIIEFENKFNFSFFQKIIKNHNHIWDKYFITSYYLKFYLNIEWYMI